MGTELHRRGADIGLPLWSANALIHAPDLVREIHEDYLAAGADIITTNTFRTNPRAVGKSGAGIDWRELTAVAVRLAREAITASGKKEALIAGSVAPVEDCYSPNLVPPDSQLAREHGLLVQALRDDGVDFILVETMNTIREALASARAAREADIPFAVSFVTTGHGSLLSGEPLADAVKMLEQLQPLLVMVNCVSVLDIENEFRILRANTDLPCGLYANVGSPRRDFDHGLHRDADDRIFADKVHTWLDLDAAVIGGCCGTTPETIALMKRTMDTIEAG